MVQSKIKKVILIIIDALRIDRVNSEVMPFLERISRKGIVFDNAFTTINATDPSLTSIYCGRYPASHGLINHGEKVTNEEIARVMQVKFCQEILSKRGFNTIAVDFLNRWHRKGFNHYYTPGSDSSIPSIKRFIWKVIDQRLSPRIKQVLKSNRKILRILRLFGKPFPYDAIQATQAALTCIKKFSDKRLFLLIHYWDTHTPYHAAREHVGRFTQEYHSGSAERIAYEPTISEITSKISGPWKHKLLEMFGDDAICNIVARYDASAHYIDRALKILYKGLEHLGVIDEAFLIITSDHGESLIEHNIFFDHHGLYDATIRVPLIMYSEALPQRKRFKAYVQHVDLAPTILNLLGVKTRIYFDGFNLLPLIFEEIADELTALRDFIYVEESYTERKFALRTTQYKYIEAASPEQAICRYCGVIHGGVEELYDLVKDPKETNNVIHIDRVIAKKMKTELREIRKRIVIGAKTWHLRKSLRRDLF